MNNFKFWFTSISNSDEEEMDEALNNPSRNNMNRTSDSIQTTSPSSNTLSIDSMINNLRGIVCGKIEDLEQITTIGKDIPRLLHRITLEGEEYKEVEVLSSSIEGEKIISERKKRMSQFLCGVCANILLQNSEELYKEIEDKLNKEVNFEMHSTFTNFVVDTFGVNSPVIQIFRCMTQDGVSQPIIYMKFKSRELFGQDYYDGKKWRIDMSVKTEGFQQTVIVKHIRLEKFLGRNSETHQNEDLCVFNWNIEYHYSRYVNIENNTQVKTVEDLSQNEIPKESLFVLNHVKLQFGEIISYNEKVETTNENLKSLEIISNNLQSLFSQDVYELQI